MIALKPAEFRRVAPLLPRLPINTLFARAVVEGHVAGRVWVDDPRAPGACYVAHPYGMSLLFGSSADDRFRRALARHMIGESVRRTSVEWLQVFPDDWTFVLSSFLGQRLVRHSATEAPDGSCIVQDTRVNFRFDSRRYALVRESLLLPEECAITDDAESIYEAMEGSVVPRAFWDSAEEFRARGSAFGLLYRGQLAAAAFASFVIDDMLELGIETVERFRGRGFAVHACSALIDHCLARGLEPIWACRLTNAGSYRLARKLGFEHARSLPYYRLPLSRHPGYLTECRSEAHPRSSTHSPE